MYVDEQKKDEAEDVSVTLFAFADALHLKPLD